MPIELVSPFPVYHVPRIWGWVQTFRDKVADDYAPKTIHDFVEDFRRKELNGQRSWAVIRDGEMGGVIQSEAISPGVRSIHAMFKREFWGHATTLPALRQACDQIFANDVRKLVALIFVDNGASINIAMSLGGVREGTLRAETIRNGEPVDVAIVGIHREAFKNGVVNRRVLKLADIGKNHIKLVDKHGNNGQHDNGAKPDAVPAEPPKPAVLVRVDPAEQPIEHHSADSGAEPRSGEPELHGAGGQPATAVR